MHITLQQVVLILGSAGAANVLTAIVSTMPAKDAEWNLRTLYGWFFDCAHSVMNSRRPSQAGQP